MRRFIVLPVLLTAFFWSAYSLLNSWAKGSWKQFRMSNLTLSQIAIIVHLGILLLVIWIAIEYATEFARRKKSISPPIPFTSNRFRALLLGGLALSSHQPLQVSTPPAIFHEKSVPTGVVLTPAMATLLIRDILSRRRQQIRLRVKPDVFTLNESHLLSDVQNLARTDSQISSALELDHSLPIVRALTSAVERIDSSSEESIPFVEPLLIVHLYGYPEVRARDGQCVSFKKKRALELTVWLSLNRDRPRRSAARTAMWQVDVSDSSFSTIVSDMRRGLSSAMPSVSRSDLVPTTYSDEIVLSQHVRTDYELLCQSLQDFRANPSNCGPLANVLRGIRDTPFSGTTYEWADLDGTTTRLIITAMQAAQELAEYALSIGDSEVMSTAVAAGLRVMPGNEELRRIQDSFISTGSLRRM